MPLVRVPVTKSIFLALAAIPALFTVCGNAFAAGDEASVAFPEKFMFRIGSYNVQEADTVIAVAKSSSGVGAAYSFKRDLGGDDNVTIPRIDAYYRFNSRHRIDFSTFEFNRDGRRVLKIDVDLGDESYTVGDTLVSDIKYNLLKVAYGYSFYRSDRVELGFTAGLNITKYEFDYERADGSSSSSSDVSAPLPMFGLRMSYAINPNWSVNYVSESFYIAIEDTLKGSFTTNELDVQYRFSKAFVVGGGLTRFSSNLAADDSEWTGKLADSHRGVMFYAGFYL